jgi:tRNA-specific 2-thiouridylase
MTRDGTRRIAVAMSGGVDSSVAAALLVEQGEDVFGIMLRLWSAGPDEANRCCTPDDVNRAREIAAQLKIPFYVLDVRELFRDTVVEAFIRGYANGLTPNPCLTCNRHIRWGFLLDHAVAMGATTIATGHYARVEERADGCHLLRAKDRLKDQSYVLSVLNQGQLSKTVLPLGCFSKPEVREKARQLRFTTSDRPESQDLCFLGKLDYRSFLQSDDPHLFQPGPVLTREGEKIGEHEGLAGYTIGQRKGIRIAADRPLYVLEKDMQENSLIVGYREELGRNQFEVGSLNWISGRAQETSINAKVRVRYRAYEVSAVVDPIDQEHARVSLERPLPDVTPGQAAVFYNDDECLGSGLILP